MTAIRNFAIALLLAASSSAPLAQTAQQPQAAQAEHSGAGPLTSEAAGQTDTTAERGHSRLAATTEEGDIAPHQVLPQAVEGQIILQGQNTFLANEFLGLTVYSAYGGAVGDVNDLLIGQDGAVAWVIIGMGGFLGIGEKQVAVEMETLSVIPVRGGDLLLLLDATKDDLQAAPPFATLDQRRAKGKTQGLEEAKDLGQQHGLADDATRPISSTQSE